MPLDPSISQGITPPPNPLAIAGQAAQLQNHLNQSALFNLNTQSQLAVGHVLQQSIGDDGEIDFTKALTLSKENPLAAYGMPAALSQNLQRQLTQGQIAEKYLKISHDALDVQNGYIGALQGKDGGGTDQEVSNAFDTAWKLVQDNPAIPEKLKQSMRTQAISNRADLPPQGDGRVAWVKEHAQRAMDSKTRLDALTGHIGTIDTGSTQLLYRYDPQDGKTKIIGSADKGVTPEVASTLTRKGDTGQMVPRAEVAPLVQGGAFRGSTGFGNGLTQNGGGPGAPGAQPQPQPGQVQPQPQPGQVQPQSSLATGGTAPASNLLSGPMRLSGPASTATSLLQEKYLDTATPKAVEYKNNLDERVQVGSDMMKRLGEVIPLLDKMHQGGLADVRAKMAEYAQGIPGVPKWIVDGINGGDLAASQEFQKFMTQYATEQLKAIMTGATGKITNLEWDVFQKNNPRLTTDPDAIKNIFNFAQKIYQQDRDEQHSFAAASTKKDFNPINWPSQWQDQMKEKGYVKDFHLQTQPRNADVNQHNPETQRRIDELLGKGKK